MRGLDGGKYSPRELRLIYTAKGDECSRLAALVEPGVLTSRIPAFIRSHAVDWYAMAAQQAEKEAKNLEARA